MMKLSGGVMVGHAESSWMVGDAESMTKHPAFTERGDTLFKKTISKTQ